MLGKALSSKQDDKGFETRTPVCTLFAKSPRIWLAISDQCNKMVSASKGAVLQWSFQAASL